MTKQTKELTKETKQVCISIKTLTSFQRGKVDKVATFLELFDDDKVDKGANKVDKTLTSVRRQSRQSRSVFEEKQYQVLRVGKVDKVATLFDFMMTKQTKQVQNPPTSVRRQSRQSRSVFKATK